MHGLFFFSRLRVLKTPMRFCVQFCFPAGQHHGRHPGPSAKGALSCYQVQTGLREVPFLQPTPGGPAKFAAGGPVSARGTSSHRCAPLTPARSCYYNTRRASGSHAVWGRGRGPRPASHSSVTGCTSHVTSQTCPCAPAQHPRRPPAPSAEAFSLRRCGARKEPREPTRKHRLDRCT